MNLLSKFTNGSKKFYFFLILLSAVNSVVYGVLLVFINKIIVEKQLLFKNYDWLFFFGILSFSLIIKRLFQNYIINLTHTVLLGMELSILNAVRQATYTSFEKLGAQRVYSAIGDTRIVGQIPDIIVNIINSCILILCALGYLFWISVVVGLIITGLMVLLLCLYLYKNKGIENELSKLRDLQDDYYKYLIDLLDGFKELKMSLRRNDTIYSKFLKNNRVEGKRLGISSSVKYMNNELIGSYSWFAILGVTLFILPNIYKVSSEQLTSFVITILYLMTPVATLISIVPLYTRVKVAFTRIQELENMLLTQVKSEVLDNELTLKDAFRTLKLVDVVYEYFDVHKQKLFVVGPINLEIVQGELIFITGGNGSGKSTFINLLTGLYEPSEGYIYFNEEKITKDIYPYYRNKIYAIFTNNYLFSSNYDSFSLDPGNEKLKEFISKLKVNNILQFVEGKDFINNNLSKGQQKRLAMIYALMEEREILVLDEWAAEQDPQFRDYFYSFLLPHFKDLGKTMLLVTHDDYYFSYCDRIIKFDFGKIVSDTYLVSKSEIAGSPNVSSSPAYLNE
jgi:cyclic peptide transporter